jgi:hypothetical protein
MPTSTLYRTLSELLDRTQTLPELVNVYVTVDSTPFHRPDYGGRWHVPVNGLDGHGRACLAVHRQPGEALANLPYSATSRELLELFDEAPFQRLFQPGETILVQAVPRFGTDLILYLNVQAVLLLRPFHAFGRRQIDFSSNCARMSYLAVTKAARVTRPRNELHWGSIGGFVAEDVFLYLAGLGDIPAEPPNGILRNALTARTIATLVLLHLSRENGLLEVQDALSKGFDTLRSVGASPALQALLKAGPWERQSEVLNNGVTVAPDLLGPRQVADLKHHVPNGNTNAAVQQVEAYLAWAMVEFGVAEVAGWLGKVVNLHSRVDPAHQIIDVQPRLDMIGRRIRNRHRLLAVSSGAWLPASVFDECHRCDLSRSPEDAPELPPACEFYCQTERHWPCHDGPAGTCQLLDVCDQHGRFFNHDWIDQFNRLRQVLLDEEEEQAAVEGLLAGNAVPMASLDGFVNLASVPGQIRLRIPRALQNMVLGQRGELFLVTVAGRPHSLARLKRQRDEDLTLTAVSAYAPPNLNEEVTLRREIDKHYPVRDQLAHLDQIQRRGEEPLVLRTSRRTTPLRIHERTALPTSSTAARLVVVDAPGLGSIREAIQKLLKSLEGRRVLLVNAGALQPAELGVKVAELSVLSLADSFGTVPFAPSRDKVSAIVTAVCEQLKAVSFWEASAEDLFGGLLDPLAAESFDDVMVINAERMHLLLLPRCLNLARERVLLVGQAIASGPRTETAAARHSILFQNPLRLLLEAGEAILPDEVQEMDIIRLPVARAAGDPERLGIRGRVHREVPIIWHECASPTFGAGGELRLVGTVPRTPGQVCTRQVCLRLLEDSGLSLRQLRLMLRRMHARTIENLQSPPYVDSSLLGYRVRVEEVQTSLTEADHKVTVLVGLTKSPWVQENGLTNAVEAEALVAYARSENRQCVAVSPFQAQCRLISSLATDLQHLRVYTPDTLGLRPLSQGTILLLSTVSGVADPDFPYPLSDPGRIAPLFVGPYECVHLFATSGVAEHHPLFRGNVERYHG